MVQETNQAFLGELCNAPLDKWLYHYTRFGIALEHILEHRKLRLSPFANMNDPRESSDWEFTPRGFPTTLGSQSYQRRVLQEANERLKRTWKVLALSTDDPSAQRSSRSIFHRGFARPRMWAHYGGNHTGVCIVFDRLKMVEEIGDQLEAKGDCQWYSEPVRYADAFDSAALTLTGDAIATDGIDLALRKHQARQYVSLFFHKNRDWATEYEYRFVVQRLDDPGYLFVEIAHSLVGIILGERVPDVYGPSVDRTTTEQGISVCQLRWSNGEPRLELPNWERPKWYQRAR
jgi:hypothetical protein